MVGEGHSEVKYQYGMFVPLSNENIDAMKKEYFYSGILRGGIE